MGISCGLVLALFSVASVPSVASVAPALGGPADALQHAELARSWLAAQGLDPAAKHDVETVLRERFTTLRLGLFELLVPPSVLEDGEAFVELGEALGALLRTQEAWLDWNGAGERSQELEAAFTTLAGWFGGWKAQDLRRVEARPGVALLEALAPKDKVKAAAETVASRLRSPSTPLAEGARSQGARMILFPARADFVAFACALGLLRSELRPWLWTDGLARWTELDFDGTRVLTFQFAATEDAAFDAPPLSMKERNPRGLQEHVAQLGARSLFESLFRERLEPAVAAGLANVLVIDFYGEVDTRTDGDLRARATAAKSAFIPGAQEGGGAAFGAGDAGGRWRVDRGKDFFVRQLRAAQKKGAKLVERDERFRAFALEDDEAVEQHVVRAPFLGAAGEQEGPPAAFRGDFQEFLRAYRVGFLHWLRAEAAGADSAARFAGLLAALETPADPAAAPAFPELIEGAYGAPLSAAVSGADDLEGRFLLWLEEQK